MVEAKARLVDKDGNPLGTAANPLKISGAVGSVWGSITGTLSNQTDLSTSLTGKASSTTATQSIYVDKAATGSANGTSWTNAFTTIQAAVYSLPAIINHDVTIYVRKGSTAYNETVTIKRIVAGGSITIRGELYWINTIASAGSGSGKFNVNAADTGIHAGDRVLLMHYTGTVGSSVIDDAFIDTVASVSGTEITLTTRTSDTFTTSWRYVIVRTEIKSLVVQSDYTTIFGLYLNSGISIAVSMQGIFGPRLQGCICESTSQATVFMKSVLCNQADPVLNVGILCGASAGSALNISTVSFGYSITGSNIAVISGAISSGTGRGHIYGFDSSLAFSYGFIKGLSGGSADGVLCNGGKITLTSFIIDGYDSSNKLPNGIRAINGGIVIPSSVTLGSNITTQKTPANWAATTDGSYIS